MVSYMCLDGFLFSCLVIRCGHCKKLAPQYSKAAATLKEQGSSVKLAKVDATEEKELAEQNAVTGFPTLFMYRHGNRYDYKGPRDHHGNSDLYNVLIMGGMNDCRNCSIYAGTVTASCCGN